jgi:hypothetical protein
LPGLRRAALRYQQLEYVKPFVFKVFKS